MLHIDMRTGRPIPENVRRAMIRASILHSGQVRKGNGSPMINHLFAVMVILNQLGVDEETQIAGLLHDSVEDVDGYSMDQLEREFGPRVRKLVEGVTEIKSPTDSTETKKTTWKARKNAYIDHLDKSDTPIEVIFICLADKIDNLEDFLSDYKNFGDALFANFNASPEELWWFYDRVSNVIGERLWVGKDDIYKLPAFVHGYLSKMVDEFKQIVDSLPTS